MFTQFLDTRLVRLDYVSLVIVFFKFSHVLLDVGCERDQKMSSHCHIVKKSVSPDGTDE